MKRSNEEFSTTVVEEQLDSGGLPQLPQPTLQLKRAKKLLTPARLLIDQIALEQDTTPAQDLLRLVVNLERELPLESLDEVELAVRCLWDRVRDCENVVLRAKMVSLLGSLARQPGANAHSVMDEMIRSLATETFGSTKNSKGCKVYLLSLVTKLALHERGQKLDMMVYEQASKALHDDYEEVRMVAIKLLWVFSHICPE
ncbi:predicted protein, partial [Nematostella vectensis]